MIEYTVENYVDKCIADDDFSAYPSGILQNKFGFVPSRDKYSRFFIEALETGKITREQLISWLQEDLSSRYLTRIQNFSVNRRSVDFSDLGSKYDPSKLDLCLEEIKNNPQCLIELIRGLSAFDKNFLKQIWEVNPAEGEKYKQYIENSIDQIRLKNPSQEQAFENILNDMFLPGLGECRPRIKVNGQDFHSMENNSLAKDQITAVLRTYNAAYPDKAYQEILDVCTKHRGISIFINDDGTYSLKLSTYMTCTGELFGGIITFNFERSENGEALGDRAQEAAYAA